MVNDSISLTWVVPCAQELSLSVTIGSTSYQMKKEQLISIDSTGAVCTSLVKGWANPVVRSYLFGAPFAVSAYIAYTAQQNRSDDQIGVALRAGDTTNVTNVNSTASESSSNGEGLSTAVLVAIIVGGIVGATFVAVALLIFLYRRRRPGANTPSPPNHRMSSGAPPNSATPLIPATMRENPWMGEQSGGPDERNVQEPRGSLNPQAAIPSNQPAHVRQSQITNSSGFSPSAEPNPHQSVPRLSAVPGQSLYGAHISSTLAAPGPQSGP
jgi:hypothetical protein